MRDFAIDLDQVILWNVRCSGFRHFPKTDHTENLWRTYISSTHKLTNDLTQDSTDDVHACVRCPLED